MAENIIILQQYKNTNVLSNTGLKFDIHCKLKKLRMKME